MTDEESDEVKAEDEKIDRRQWIPKWRLVH